MKPTYAAIDVETTGLDENVNEIIQFSGLLLDENLNILREVEILAHPARTEGCEEALKINGYTKELWDARGAGDQVDLLNKLQTFFTGCRRVMAIGHNVKFDIGMLNSTYRRAGMEKVIRNTLSYHSLDTVSITLFCDLVRTNQKAESYKLTEVCQRMGVPLENAHDASSDVRASLNLLRYLVVAMRGGTPLPGPASNESKLMVKGADGEWVFTRGRHQGQTALDISLSKEASYLRWVLREIPELSEEQKEYLRKVLDAPRE